MTRFQSTTGHAAGAFFDRMAATYDHEFTNSLVGRAQRNEVWKVLLKTFDRNANVLELNCGTGEDAFFLTENGISVFACDASPLMIARAEQKLMLKSPVPPIVFCQLATERIHELAPAQSFDGVFSNFSGLNCIADLKSVASSLSRMVKTGDKLLLCFSTRICLIEIVYYLLRRNTDKAFRRIGGRTNATLKDDRIEVFYPTLAEICDQFAPHFRLRSTVGIGLAIPPSYLEPWVRRHPHAFQLLSWLEKYLAHIPLLRTTGDHVLLTFEKVTP